VPTLVACGPARVEHAARGLAIASELLGQRRVAALLPMGSGATELGRVPRPPLLSLSFSSRPFLSAQSVECVESCSCETLMQVRNKSDAARGGAHTYAASAAAVLCHNAPYSTGPTSIIEIASGALCSNSEKGSASTMIYRQLGLRWVQQGRADQSTVRYLGPQ